MIDVKRKQLGRGSSCERKQLGKEAVGDPSEASQYLL